MDRRKFALSFLGSAALAACGGGDDPAPAPSVPEVDPAPPAPPPPAPPPPAPTLELATLSSLPVFSAFPQTIAQGTGATEDPVAPGQANQWEFDSDFTLSDGGHDQFDNALTLSVINGAVTASFPYDQTYAELKAYGPEFDASQGVKSVSFTNLAAYKPALATDYALLHAGVPARLSQRLVLPAAGAATYPLTLTWTGDQRSGAWDIDDPGYVRVVLRDEAGALLTTLYERPFIGATTGTWGNGSIPVAYAGQAVLLCFEQSAPSGYTTIANVVVSDGVTANFLLNGTFASNGDRWTASSAKAARNIRSGMRVVNGLEVTRMFYAEPTKVWGRMVDEFRNPGVAPVSVTVEYKVNLGSDGGGVSYEPTGAAGKAMSSWDGSASDPDVGWVFGSATTLTYASATALNANDGSNNNFVRFNITVPAGGTVSLANFLILSPDTTGTGAASVAARATAVDTEAARIVAEFSTSLVYRRGMTQQQLDTLANF